jgi:N-acetylmuramoyl-L-alanine amidase
MKFLIDPGHGGHDPGAVNPLNKREEEDITLEVGLRLADTLRNDYDHNVILTRAVDSYLSPSQRLSLIRDFKPHGFVSIHCNAAGNPQAHGIETLYRDDYDFWLASCIHQELIAFTELRDRGVKNDIEDLHRRLAVLHDLKTPACLVEIGFITNAGDLAVMENTVLIADAIACGIQSWVKKECMT